METVETCSQLLVGLDQSVQLHCEGETGISNYIFRYIYMYILFLL